MEKVYCIPKWSNKFVCFSRYGSQNIYGGPPYVSDYGTYGRYRPPVPRSDIYAPASDFGPPRAPLSDYGPIRSSASDYGGGHRPGNYAASDYGHPPASDYGHPTTSNYGHPPASDYGQPPVTDYGQPLVSDYGQPPTSDYGIPPPIEYGQPPAGDYGFHPASDYGRPAESDYGYPSDYGRIATPPPATLDSRLATNVWSRLAVGSLYECTVHGWTKYIMCGLKCWFVQYILHDIDYNYAPIRPLILQFQGCETARLLVWSEGSQLVISM